MPNINKRRGDTVYIDVNFRNTGNARATIYVGCSIIAPNGYITDLPPKNATLDPNQATTVRFQETLGPATGIGVHRVAVALWNKYPTPGDPELIELDRDESWTITVSEITTGGEIIYVNLF